MENDNLGVLKVLRRMEKRKQRSALCGAFEVVARSERALSPIFATLIILAVVTVLFIPIFIWTTGSASQTEESWQTTGLIATERIVIEEVNLRVSQDNCIIYVRNIGKTAVAINDVLIITEAGNVFAFGQSEIVTKDPLGVNPLNSIVQGDLIRIEIINLDDKGLTVVGDETYTIKVFTKRGVGGEFQIVAEP